MPYRISPEYGVFQGGKYVYGLTEISSLSDMIIHGIQRPRQLLSKLSVADLDALGLNAVVYEQWDSVVYSSSGPVETVENYIIRIRHPNLTPRYTIEQVKDHITKLVKREFMSLDKEVDDVLASLLKAEGNQDPDYISWDDYDQELQDTKQVIKGMAIALDNQTNPSATYDDWVNFGRTWQNNLPGKPESVSSVSAVNL